VARQVLNVLNFDENAAGAFGEFSPYGRQLRPARRSLYQRYAQPFFKGAKLLAQRWLRDMARLGGAPKMARVRERHKILELAKGCHRISSPSYA